MKKCKESIISSFKSIPDFQETVYEGKIVKLNCYIEFTNELNFIIKTNENIDLKKILIEKERGVGSKSIEPNGALFRFKRKIIESFKELGIKRKKK